MLQKFLLIAIILCSITGSAQWQQTGSKVRYVNGIGIPTRDTAAGVVADSSQIVIRPQDSALYVKYKRTWLKVGGSSLDTAAMLLNYLRKSDTSSMLSQYQRSFNSVTSAGLDAYSNFFGAHYFIPMPEMGNTRNLINSEINIGTATRNLHYEGTTAMGAYSFGAAGFPRGLNSPGSMFVNTGTQASGANWGFGTESPTTTSQEVKFGAYAYPGLGSQVTSTITGYDGLGNNYSISTFNTDGMTLFRPRLRVQNTANTVQVDMISGSTTDGGFVTTATNHDLRLGTNNVERIRISNSGLVGIGISPTQSFQLFRSVNNAHISQFRNTNSGSSASSGIEISNNTGLGLFQNINSSTFAGTFWGLNQSNLVSMEVQNANSSWIFNLANSTGTMAFGINSTEAFRINSSRRILMNQTSDNNFDILQVNGTIQAKGLNQTYAGKNAAYTATREDYFIDCTSGTFTITLFPASGNAGRILIIKNSGTGTITVDGDIGDTIDGASTYSLSTQYATIQIASDGMNWKIISKF